MEQLIVNGVAYNATPAEAAAAQQSEELAGNVEKMQINGQVYDIRDVEDVEALDRTKLTVTQVEWGDGKYLYNFLVGGTYHIRGTRTNVNDDLPMSEAGANATIDAQLLVLESSIVADDGTNNRECITQILSLSNRLASSGDVYVRTGIGRNKGYISFAAWRQLGTAGTGGGTSSSDTSALRALFIAAGAEYNDTGVDIIKTTPWAAYVDEVDFKAANNIDVLNYTTADLLSIVQDGTTYQYVVDNGVYKVVGRASRGQIVLNEQYCVHRAGHYYLNGLGDITKEQMTVIYNNGNTLALKYFFNTYKGRTNKMFISAASTAEIDGYYFARDCECEVLSFDKGSGSILSVKSPDNVFGNMFKLAHLLGRYRFESAATNAFYNCKQLKSVKIHQLKYNLSLSDCPLISKKSILYAINNSTATTAITITLHANAYARFKDNPEIVSALASKPLVTLVSA